MVENERVNESKSETDRTQLSSSRHCRLWESEWVDS